MRFHFFGRWLVLLSLTASSGCQTVVDDSIQLQDDFSSRADLIRIKDPTWQIKNKHFERQLGDYQAINFKRSLFTPVKRKKLEGRKLDESLFDIILFNLIFNNTLTVDTYSREIYESKSTRKFSYDIANALNEPIVNAACKSVDLSHSEIIKQRFRFGMKPNNEQRRQENTEDWVSTALVCMLSHGSVDWKVTLLSTQDKPVEIAIEPAESAQNQPGLTVDQLTAIEQTLSDGQGNQTIRRYQGRNDRYYPGAAIKMQGEQIGAISFAGTQKKLWLDRSLPSDLREVLLGAMYGLILQTWLSDSWQQRQASR